MALLLRHRPRALCQCTRLFSISTTRPISLQLERNDPETIADTVPAYPYGPARWYKQSNKGLYGGQRIQFGNNVGPKSKTKTRRKWHVSVFQKRLWSKALNRFVQVRVSARTLRTIGKLGGLDEYLLGEKEARIKQLGMSGWWLRWAIMRTETVRRRFERERRELGLPESKEMVERRKRREEFAEMKRAAQTEEQRVKIDEAEEMEDEVEELGAAFEALPLADDGGADVTALESDAYAEQGAQDQVSELEAEESELLEGEEEALEAQAVAENDQFYDDADTALQAPMDDTFQIEHTPGLPPLKFRVGKGRHLVLTVDGWRRTREGPFYRAKLYKDKHRVKRAEWVERQMQKFEAELDRQQQLLHPNPKQQRRAPAVAAGAPVVNSTGDVGVDPDLTSLLLNVHGKEEREALLKRARREFEKSLEERIEGAWERKVAEKEKERVIRSNARGRRRAEEGGWRTRKERVVEP